MEYLIWILYHTKGIRYNILIRILIGTGRVGLGLLMVWLCKMFIDETIHTGSTSDILWMILLLITTVVGGILLRQAYYYMTITANARVTNNIRLHIFQNLFKRQLYSDHQIHSGDITSRMSKDIEMVSEASTSSIPQVLVTASQLLGAFVLMYSMDSILAWMILVLTPFAIILGKVISNQLRVMTLKIRDDESKIQMQIQEGMELNAVLRALNSEKWIINNLYEKQLELWGNIIHRAKYTVIMRTIFSSVFGLGYLLAFIWGGLQLQKGRITFGVLTSFLQLVEQIQVPILTLLNIVTQLIHTSASIERLKELEMLGKSSKENVGLSFNTNCSASHPEIRIKAVSFQYATGDKMVLNHFSHTFSSGSKTALLGETGVGKTTLFRLMLALVQPESGTLSIVDNGVERPINEDTRNYFVFVPQGNTLMSGSIRFNLLLANPQASEEELRDVLHTAVADFVFDFPEGLETELGEHANCISEGQAQRISIARGLLRPGNILLLDEISSSLDEHTEQMLYERLIKKYPYKTMIFITHRSSVLKICDEVITLK